MQWQVAANSPQIVEQATEAKSARQAFVIREALRRRALSVVRLMEK